LTPYSGARALCKPARPRRRRLFKGHTGLGKGLPSDAAFSLHAACVKGKLEFGGKIRSAWNMQAGTAIAQIADDAIDRRAVGKNQLGGLENFGPRKPPTLKHGKPPNSNLPRLFSPNLLKNCK
jgi:hypothetical protein